MKALVVYESLWGNTAAIARAVAEGIGPGAQALSTAEAAPEIISGAVLVVAGSPVHSLNMPTEQSRQWARSGSLGPGGTPPDLSHPMMRTWLDELPRGSAKCAAFDTCVKAWYGRGAAHKILKELQKAGYQPVSKARGFYVTGHPIIPTANGTLREGELERARQWGAELARSMK
jgi:hypothetical protein